MSSLIAAADLLVVDDHEMMRAMLQTVLRAFGASEVRVAGGVNAAWAEIERAPPDLMLLDQTMPDGRGLDLLACLRGRRDLAQPAVLMLSGHDDPAFAAQAIASGAQGVLTKPISNELLLWRIDLALAARLRAAARACG